MASPKEAVGGATPDNPPVPPAKDAPIDVRWNWVLEHLPAIGKDSTNKQQGFKYRSVDTVLDHLNPLLSAAGVHIVPVYQQAQRESRGTRSGGTLNVCYITVSWEIRDLEGHVIRCQTLGEGTDSGDKSTSKAQTMAFKYLLWPSLAIAENEDPDGETAEPTSRSEAPRNPSTPRSNDPVVRFAQMEPPDPYGVTQQQINKIRIELNKQGMSDGTDVQKAFKEALPEGEWPELGLEGLTKAEASALIDHLVMA